MSDRITREKLLHGISEAMSLHEIAVFVGGVTDTAIWAALKKEGLHDDWKLAVQTKRADARKKVVKAKNKVTICKCCGSNIAYNRDSGRPRDYCDDVCKLLYRSGLTGEVLEAALKQHDKVLVKVEV